LSATIDYLLCEGYLDRDFLAGALQALGCKNGAKEPGPGGVAVVGAGRQAWVSPSGGLVVVAPVGGEGKLGPAAKKLVAGQATSPIRRLWFVTDSDALAPGGRVEGEARVDGLIERTREALRAVPGLMEEDWPELGGFSWWTTSPPGAVGVHDKQTLERVICAAWAEDQARAASVSRWLDDPPTGDGPSGKHFAMSWFAKYTAAESQAEEYQAIWRDPSAQAALLRVLGATGALGALRELLR
jgi:hypothetical protein